jgi:hypothetical protein
MCNPSVTTSIERRAAQKFIRNVDGSSRPSYQLYLLALARFQAVLGTPQGEM